jgi:cytochrome c peroxidase
MTWNAVATIVAVGLGLAVSAHADYDEEEDSGFVKQQVRGAPAVPCPPTAGALPANDVARGQCLFHSRTAFGQDPLGPFANCATCHYGNQTTDRGTHLIQITNSSGETIQVLRRTPSLLNAAVNFPYGWDGRLRTIQEAARGAILSPVEMNGTHATQDQLDALAAFVLDLGAPRPEPLLARGNLPQPPAPPLPPGTLARIGRGKLIFFGKGTCATCHPAPNFTNNSITTNQVRASFSGNTDPGAGFVGTGQTGQFKVPSLLHFGSLPPFMHNGALAKLDQVIRFYNQSLGLHLSQGEMTDLEYWLNHCLRGGANNPNRPATC